MLNWCNTSFAGAGLIAILLAVGQPARAADPVVPLPDDERAQLEKYLGKGVVGEALPSGPLMGAAGYLPAKGATLSYRVLEEDEDPRTETHKVKDTTEAPFAPGWHYAAEPIGDAYMRQTSDGGVEIIAQSDLSNKVMSRFTPGEPIIVTGLRPGENRKSTVKVEVSDLSDLSDIDHTGSLDVTYTYIGTYKVTVPAGTYDAQLIRWDYKGEVGPADVEESEYRLIAPKAGMVAMIEVRSISAMLIYSDHTKLGKLLEKVE
jgi:hypothetical protein